MCIICNTTPHTEVADTFLVEFERARQGMKAAADAMLACSRVATTPEHRKRYGAIHKAMVRQTREWNKLEQKREHEPTR